ncbi:unnamed protein product, partial [Choristocarpus tenellus]
MRSGLERDKTTVLEALFGSLRTQAEETEDGLLAGMVMEVISTLTLGLRKASVTANLAWTMLRRTFPMGYGQLYLGGCHQTLRLDRSNAELLSRPVALRAIFHQNRVVKALSSRLRPQFSPLVSSPLSTGPSGWISGLPILRQFMITHWALEEGEGREKGLAAAVCDLGAFLLGYGKTSGTGTDIHSNKRKRSTVSGKDDGKESRSKIPLAPLLLPLGSPLSMDTFDLFLSTTLKLLPPSIAIAQPSLPLASTGSTSNLSMSRMTDGCTNVRHSRHSFINHNGSNDKEAGKEDKEVKRWIGISKSPYRRAERLTLVFRCLVEACSQCLRTNISIKRTNGEAESVIRGGSGGGQTLGGLLRRCVLPVARCCAPALRSLEWQLDYCLAW